MVRGCSIAVTITPRVCQWAEMHRIALGRPRAAPTRAQPRLKALSSMAFIGLPCPTKSAGIRPSRRSPLASARASAGMPLTGTVAAPRAEMKARRRMASRLPLRAEPRERARDAPEVLHEVGRKVLADAVPARRSHRVGHAAQA